jgi:hypothetical protein
LRNNPDVQAAEAKVREAEAELRRAKVVLALKLSEQRSAVQSQQRLLEAQEEEYQMYLNLFKRGAGSEIDMRRARQALLLAKAQFAQAESALTTLTGAVPGQPAVPGRGAAEPAPAGGGPFGAGMPGLPNAGFGGGMGLGGESPARAPRGPMADTIRKALETTFTLIEFKSVPLGEVVAYFRGAAPGVPFLTNLGEKGMEPVSLTLKANVPLGAGLQALQDVVPGLQCFVREYGILVVVDDNGPHDGMPLIDFWHKKAEK